MNCSRAWSMMEVFFLVCGELNGWGSSQHQLLIYRVPLRQLIKWGGHWGDTWGTWKFLKFHRQTHTHNLSIGCSVCLFVGACVCVCACMSPKNPSLCLERSITRKETAGVHFCRSRSTDGLFSATEAQRECWSVGTAPQRGWESGQMPWSSGDDDGNKL